MNFFSLKSLRVRLLLLVLVAVLPAWGMIAYTATEQRRIAVAQIQRNVLQLVEFSADKEDQALQGTRQILIALADFVREMDENPADCSAFCANLLKQFRRYANMGAVKSNGDIFCSAVPLNKSTNVADQLWFKRAAESGAFAAGNYHVCGITGKPVLVLSYPYRVDEREPAVVVFAALDLKWLNRYIFEIQTQLPDGSTVTQIDENAVVLARQPNAEQWLG